MSSPTSSGPPDSRIERVLRDIVAARFQDNDLESLTLKRVRADAAKDLNLDEDFFKTDAQWKDKSKQVVNDEVARQEAQQHEDSKSSPVAAKKRGAVKKSIESSASPPPPRPRNRKASAGVKRKSPQSKQTQPKRPRVASTSGSDLTPMPVDSSELSEPPSEPPGKQPSEPLSEPEPEPEPERDSAGKSGDGGASDSEMSVVLDEPPAKRRGSKKSASAEKPDTTKAKSRNSKSKPATSSASTNTPQEEEIKKLQGWLVKCGIRKLWGKELAPYSTPREKIAHLKQLLKDAGMASRFSEQRAREIREQRELRADLDDIVEREKIWGESDDENGEEGSDARPRRRLAKGLKELQEFAEDEESSA